MRRKIIVPLVIAGLLMIIAVSASDAAAGRKTGPIWETPPPEALLHLVPMTPNATPGLHTCGYWSSPDGAVGGPLSQKYGELRNCYFFENDWIITTLGLKGQSGVIAIYRCAPTDAACLDGQTEHPLAGWKIYEPPCPSGITLAFGQNYAAGKIHIFSQCALWFDVNTGTFSDK